MALESGLTQKTLIAAAIIGMKKAWDKEGQFTFPFVMTPEKTYRKKIECCDDIAC